MIFLCLFHLWTLGAWGTDHVSLHFTGLKSKSNFIQGGEKPQNQGILIARYDLNDVILDLEPELHNIIERDFWWFLHDEGKSTLL